MATLENIQQKIAKLQTQAGALAEKQATAGLDKIRAVMEKHGITTADIESYMNGKRRGRKPGADTTAKANTGVAKYLDPKTGATWSGRGRAPAWIAKAKDRNRFLTAAPSAKPAQVAPKYRNPKTGETWSGRGRAPAWIAGAKSRNRFLINGEA